ncbi:transporter [Flavobacterium sp. UBA6135]|uniref:transporter n=1 Tax=Flavobacterium sp. UBA6135 TaxID=1946553 RepID=UPI0025BB30EB|nr:transporter [Flavobacterium sp. UBA6135]
MTTLKKSSLLFALFLVQLSFGQHTDVINSNRPGESMTAYSVGKTVFQVESGIYFNRENHKLLGYEATGMGLNLDLRYGFFLEQLEFVLNSQMQFDQYTAPLIQDNRSGFRNLTFGAKYLFYDPYKNYEEKVNIYSWKANQKFNWRRLLPAVAVYAGANFVVGDAFSFPEEPSFSPKAMVVTQQHLTNHLVFVTNIFADRIGTDFQSFGYVITLTNGFNEKWSGFLENKGIQGDYYADSILTVGAAYLLFENFQIDASLSKNFKDTPDIFYGGIGCSWRFDKKHRPIMLEKEDPADKRDGKKKKKEKEEKKRLDEIEG